MADQMRICIINRNYPPVEGATGYHAHQLVQFLLENTNFKIDIVTCGDLSNYNSDRTTITYCREQYNGPNSKLRLVGATRSAYQLIKIAQKLSADFYIVMTDPQVLNYWAARLFKKRFWALWTMDLFPDAFVAGRLIDSKSRLLQHYKNVIRKHPPNFFISLGPEQAQYLQAAYYPNTEFITWPVGLREEEPSQELEKPSWHDPNKITFGYLGNLGEAHDPDWLIELSNHLDPKQHQLIISCQGKHRDLIHEKLSTCPAVHLSDYIDGSHLRFIDIYVVILRSEWTHICVPSKAISAVQHGGVVLYCGDAKSDTWQYVSSCGWHISDIGELKPWLKGIDNEDIRRRKNRATLLHSEHKNERNEGWKNLISQIQQGHSKIE